MRILRKLDNGVVYSIRQPFGPIKRRYWHLAESRIAADALAEQTVVDTIFQLAARFLPGRD